MLNDQAADAQVYLVTGYTDLRRGIDGLATNVHAQLELDPFSKALFLFCGIRCDRFKGLLWEGDGFLLLYKRLDNGTNGVHKIKAHDHSRWSERSSDGCPPRDRIIERIVLSSEICISDL